MKRRFLLAGAGLAIGLIFLGGSLWNWIAARRAGPEALGHVPDFTLPAATANGPTTLALADLRGHPWVADFIFTRCGGPCPLMSAKMAELQKVLPNNVRLITFTVDPDRDDQTVLAEYARRFEADPARWFFLRADKPTLYKLVFEGFKLPMMEDPAAESGFRVIHSTKFVLVDGQGRIRQYFESSNDGMARRMADAASALMREVP
ncbi:MAG: SCO family protein [Elusimicrobia bacterium]|nr:SCO family protein [Elusimicrobiota bacterium]